MQEYFKKEKITFKDIIYQTILDIEKKSLIEFRGGQKRTVVHSNWSETTIEPDSRKEYIQSIECLYDLFYATITNEENYPPKYKEYFKTINKDCEEIEKQVDNLLKQFEKKELERDEFVIQRLRLMRKLFRVLMLALNVTNIAKKTGDVG